MSFLTSKRWGTHSHTNMRFKVTILIPILLLTTITIGFAKEINDVDFLHQNNEESVHTFGNFLKSAAIPGFGELSLKKKSGYIFLLTEVFAWSSRAYFLEEARIFEKDAYRYAITYSGINANKLSKEHYDLMSRYNSSGFQPGGYNEKVLQKANALYPNNKEKQTEYLNENAILDDNLTWEWESREHRRQYSIRRKNADHNRDYAKAMVGAIIANHLVSGLNATILANKVNKENNLKLSVDYEINKLCPIFSVMYRF